MTSLSTTSSWRRDRVRNEPRFIVIAPSQADDVTADLAGISQVPEHGTKTLATFGYRAANLLPRDTRSVSLHGGKRSPVPRR